MRRCLIRLEPLVENGPHPQPGQTGAKYIIREDGQRLDLRFLKKDSDRHLQFGYKVAALVCALGVAARLPDFIKKDSDRHLQFGYKVQAAPAL